MNIKRLICVVIITVSAELIASVPPIQYHFDARTRMHIFDISGVFARGAAEAAASIHFRSSEVKQSQTKKENPGECVAIKFPSFASICKCPMHRLKHSSYKKAQ